MLLFSVWYEKKESIYCVLLSCVLCRCLINTMFCPVFWKKKKEIAFCFFEEVSAENDGGTYAARGSEWSDRERSYVRILCEKLNVLRVKLMFSNTATWWSEDSVPTISLSVYSYIYLMSLNIHKTRSFLLPLKPYTHSLAHSRRKNLVIKNISLCWKKHFYSIYLCFLPSTKHPRPILRTLNKTSNY